MYNGIHEKVAFLFAVAFYKDFWMSSSYLLLNFVWSDKGNDYACEVCLSFYHVCQKLILVQYVHEFLTCLPNMFISFESDKGKDYACAICSWVFTSHMPKDN